MGMKTQRPLCEETLRRVSLSSFVLLEEDVKHYEETDDCTHSGGRYRASG